jgi:hypothetical protein
LHDFDYLEPKLTMSPRLQLLARYFAGVPLVAGLLNQLIYVDLAFMIEVYLRMIVDTFQYSF